MSAGVHPDTNLNYQLPFNISGFFRAASVEMKDG